MRSSNATPDTLTTAPSQLFAGTFERFDGRDRRALTVLDIGFGDGSGFAAALTWLTGCVGAERHATSDRTAGQTFDATAKTLHYVMVAPPAWPASRRGALLARLHGVVDASLLGSTIERLNLAGLHRLTSSDSRLNFTIATGDPDAIVANLRLRADLILLPGAMPVSASLAKALARLADESALLAASALDSPSRTALDAAGFQFGAHFESNPKELDEARFAPRWRVRRHSPPLPFSIDAGSDGPAGSATSDTIGAGAQRRQLHQHASPAASRNALVIGAGVAGTALTERLAATGWRVQLFDRLKAPGQAASGNPAGVFHPALALAETPLTRLSRTAFELALQRWMALGRHGLNWHPDGLVQLDRDGELARVCQREGWDPALVSRLDADEASALAGVRLTCGGLLMHQAGWLEPASLCRANLLAAGDRVHFHSETSVVSLRRSAAGAWEALDEDGRLLGGGDIAIIANAGDAAQLLEPLNAPLTSFRGQVTRLDSNSSALPTVPLIGEGYVSPCDGGFVAGASYAQGTNCEVTQSDHLGNLARAAALSPSFASLGSQHVVDGRAALRSATADHLPMIGAIADLAAARRDTGKLLGARLADMPRQHGLFAAFAFGSRGLLWSALAAEVVAAMLDASPSPLESDLLDAIDPARYAVRALRRNSL